MEEIYDIKERIKSLTTNVNISKSNHVTKQSNLESEISYLKEENQNKNLIIKNLLENEKLLLSNNNLPYNTPHSNQSASNIKEKDNQYIKPRKTSPNTYPTKSTGLPLKNRFNIFNSINDNEVNLDENKANQQSFEPSSPKINNREKRNSNGKRKQKTTVIVGDSIVKKVIGKRIAYKAKENVIVKSYKGATIDCMRYHVQPSLKRKPDQVILQFGTNNMNTKETAQEIADQLIDLAEAISTHTNKVVISSILPRGDEYNEKVEEVNYLLELYCEQENNTIDFLNHSTLTCNHHISNDGLHPNWKGIQQLEKDYVSFLTNR